MTVAKPLRSYDPREILADCSAVIRGSHFVYASGLHGAQYVDKATVFKHAEHFAALCGQIVFAFADVPYDVVVGPESGGAKIADEVVRYARRLHGTDRGVTSVPATKTADGGFAFGPGLAADIVGRRVLVVEDVLTTGGSCRKTVELVRASSGEVVGVGAFVNRGGVTASDLADVPSLVSLVRVDFQTWDEKHCPFCASGVPIRTDLGKGSDFLAKKHPTPKATAYRSMDEMLGMIGGTNADICKRILASNRRLFEKIAASNTDHQCWDGGWLDHVTEAMNVALLLYGPMAAVRPLPFTAGDALLALFLHHLDKVWRYEVLDGDRLGLHATLNTDEECRAYRRIQLRIWGLELTEEHRNALYFARGDWEDYANANRELGSLAAFCNMCVMASSRVWGAHPLVEGEPWTGATRARKT